MRALLQTGLPRRDQATPQRRERNFAATARFALPPTQATSKVFWIEAERGGRVQTGARPAWVKEAYAHRPQTCHHRPNAKNAVFTFGLERLCA